MNTTLRDFFVDALDRFGDRPAVTCDGRRWSYREIVTSANRLAHFLRARGIGPGSTVALMMSNSAEYVIADQAILRCGAAKVPLNDLLVAPEARYILADCGAEVALATPSQLDVALAALAAPDNDLRLVVDVDGQRPRSAGVTSWDEALSGFPDTPPDVTPAPDDVGLILYTGGTTGRPKGVVHRQSPLVLNLISHVLETGFSDDEQLLLTSPLPHSAGFLLQAGMTKGAHAFVEAGFDPELVLERIERDQVTFAFLVPTMIYRLLDRAAGRSLDLSSLRTLLYGAAPIARDRLEQGLATFGPVFMQLYGQSEAPNFITRLRREDHGASVPERLASCGQAVLMARVRVLDEQGHEREPGEIGEIVAQTPYTMSEYHGLPEKTSQTVRQGWLYTGDLGFLDADGYVYLVDRKNDMIITGGMNVYSIEVETVIAQLASVGQTAVVGIPHPDWGEAVVAFVVAARPGEAIDPDAVRERCRRELSKYKQPKAVRQLDALPVTALGKVDKKRLRAEWEGW